MFDIYSHYGYSSNHDFSYLVNLIPDLNIEKTIPLLMTDKQAFLGLSLSLDIAKHVLKFLNDLEPKRSHGRIIPIRYRDEKPKFTPETAYPIAENEMKKRQSKYPQITFGPLTYGLECFAFFSAGKEWQESGVIPGALFLNVDKLDGHVWEDHEGNEFNL
jgi:hypothetical protein